jgi:uncharacterized membrane protein
LDYQRRGETPQARSTAASEAGLFSGVLAIVMAVVDAYLILSGMGDPGSYAILLLVAFTLCLASVGFVLSAVGAFRHEEPRYVAVAGLVTNTLAGAVPVLMVRCS